MLSNPAWVDAGFQIDVPADAQPVRVASLTIVARTTEGTTWSRSLGVIVHGSFAVAAASVAQTPPPPLQITSPDCQQR
jgi:hypothetical protein